MRLAMVAGMAVPAPRGAISGAETLGFGVAWRAVHRALARIPKQEADQAREAQLARLQAVRVLVWNHAMADPACGGDAPSEINNLDPAS
jgi:hypothetical protein